MALRLDAPFSSSPDDISMGSCLPPPPFFSPSPLDVDDVNIEAFLPPAWRAPGSLVFSRRDNEEDGPERGEADEEAAPKKELVAACWAVAVETDFFVARGPGFLVVVLVAAPTGPPRGDDAVVAAAAGS